MEHIFQDINKHMLETTYTLKLGHLLKITPDLKKYMWHKLKLGNTNITTKMISKPIVATLIETHYEINTIVIVIDNQMAIIQVQIKKNIIEDVLLAKGTNVSIITKNLRKKLGLPKPRLTQYHLKMANLNTATPLRIIKNLKIQIHSIPYVTTFTVL